MRGIVLAAFLAMLAGAGASFAQQSPPGPTDENLMLTLPRGFKQVVSGGQPQVTGLAQYVPEHETKDDWTLMLSVHLFYRAAHLTPRQIYGAFEERYKATCAEFASHPTDLNVRGYPGLAVFLSCRIAPDAPRFVPQSVKIQPQQFMHLKVIQGRDAAYMLQFEWQGPADVQPKPMTDEATRRIFIEPIRDAYVCDSRLPDRPCFSR